jgi:hypothetical protein
MNTIENLIASVMHSESLDTLSANLNALQIALDAENEGQSIRTRIDEICDITSLPLFTADTDIPENDGDGGAYSWDARRFLTRDENNEWVIRSREIEA